MTRNQPHQDKAAMTGLDALGIAVDKDGLAGVARSGIDADKDGLAGVARSGIDADKDGLAGADAGQSRRSVLLIVGLLLLSLLAWAATSAYGAGIGGIGGIGGSGGDGGAVGGSGVGDAAGGTGGQGGTKYLAQVKAGDGQVYQLPLEDDGSLDIDTPLGINTIVVSNGEVFVEEADCPGGDCLRQGGISRPGQTIVCLPHRLVVEIIAVSADDAGLADSARGDSADDASGGGANNYSSTNSNNGGADQQRPAVDTISE